jgi:alpha-tubulin suppressor-like RCC1 family protein
VLPGPPTDLAVLTTSACAVVAHAVWCWSLETGVKPSASALAGAERVSRISAAGPHACALRDDGRVVCWGGSIFGEVGSGTIARGPLPPSDVGLSDVVELAAGEYHQCARRRSGTVACWGMGYEGTQCSNYQCSAVPVDVPLPAPATQIAAGGIETCARLADGTSYCWKVEAGKVTAPAPNTKIPPRSAIRLGYALGCALPPDHRPICWGGLGHNDPVVTVDYAPIAGLAHVAEYASGFYHACIRGEDGAVRCFGSNDLHQLGDGTTVDAASPGAPVRCGG